MPALPKWIDAARWERMSTDEHWNALGALDALTGRNTLDASMACMRGLPAEPDWMVPGMGAHITIKGVQRLKRTVDAALKREQAAAFARQRNLKVRQRACVHDFVSTVHVDTRHCRICGYIDG